MFLIFVLAMLEAPAPSPPSTPIVVTGRRVDTAEIALKACLARHCPADKDIDATLALAESQIIAGKYHDARQTLLKSLERNKQQANLYPIPVSELYRANGKVAAHLGLDNDYYQSTWGIYRTLKNGLPSAKDRQFSALVEVAEMIGRTRGHLAASRYYVSIARQAREAGRPDIAALANLRSLIRHSPPGSDRDREIQKIANAADPAIRAAALEANLALARIAFEQKNLSEGQALLHKLDRFAIKRPILVYQPRYEFIQQDRGNGEGGIHFDLPATDGSSPRAAQRPGLESLSTTKRMAGNFDDLWIDVAFQIMPDGTVSNLKIADKRGDTFWMEPVLASIKQRRYTPGRPGDPNSTRLERYTYTSGWQVATGTHMLERSPEARVEYFDLSPEGGIAAN